MLKPKSDRSFKGYVQVYTGNGKGKTTAAMGLALRAAGHGFRTYVGQFCKGRKTGEIAAVRKLAPLITIEQFGDVRFLHAEEPPAASDIARARKGLARCRAAMLSGDYRIVVLDEINLALYFKLLVAGRSRGLPQRQAGRCRAGPDRPQSARLASAPGRSGHRDARGQALLRGRRRREEGH